jgi:hypothetical protein
MLIGSPVLARETPVPHPGIYLGYGRATGGDNPTVEGPEVDLRAEPLPYETKPRKTGVSRFRHRSRHMEVENGFRRAGALLRQTAPTRVATARRARAVQTFEHEVDVNLPIRRPMMLEVVEKCGPIALQAIGVEILPGEGKAVVDADQYRLRVGQSFDQPFRDASPTPVFPQRGRRRDFEGNRVALGREDAQTRQAVAGDAGAGIVYADIARERRHAAESMAIR